MQPLQFGFLHFPAHIMKELFPRTSLSIDEAVAVLLGWIDGPVIYKSATKNASDKEIEALDSPVFSLQDELIDEMESLQDALIEAKDDKKPAQDIANLRKSIQAYEELVTLARSYRDAIEDEISKGSNSVLLVDPKLSNEILTYIRRNSFDEWVSKRNGDKPAPRRAMREQEEAILQAIRTLGYEPKSLPKPPSGKPGVKSNVKESLRNDPLFQSKGIFDKAWERLRSDGSIVDTPPPHKKLIGDGCGGG
jgi:hypothetical protein